MPGGVAGAQPIMAAPYADWLGPYPPKRSASVQRPLGGLMTSLAVPLLPIRRR